MIELLGHMDLHPLCPVPKLRLTLELQVATLQVCNWSLQSKLNVVGQSPPIPSSMLLKLWILHVLELNMNYKTSPTIRKIPKFGTKDKDQPSPL